MTHQLMGHNTIYDTQAIKCTKSSRDCINAAANASKCMLLGCKHIHTHYVDYIQGNKGG